MNSPDPVPSRLGAAMQSVKPSTSTVASAGAGIPAGVVAVYILETYLTGPLPDEVKMSVAALVAIAVGYFFSGGRSNDTV
jgi:peptidoglycan/LPS O-acetylase OafA/YrhL